MTKSNLNLSAVANATGGTIITAKHGSDFFSAILISLRGFFKASVVDVADEDADFRTGKIEFQSYNVSGVISISASSVTVSVLRLASSKAKLVFNIPAKKLKNPNRDMTEIAGTVVDSLIKFHEGASLMASVGAKL